jgi:hypothetical protein
MSSPVQLTLRMLFSMVVFSACYYDKEEILYPGSLDCNPATDQSFSADILPLLNARCNNCHGGSSPSAGIRLDSFSEATKNVNNGSFMGSINQLSGYSPMPKNGTKLSACEIKKIQRWIDSGALNN